MSELEEPLYCVNHPKTETRLRCNRCGNPICPKCAVQTPVGFRCKQCIRGQQAIFYSATPLDYLIAVVIGLVASTVAAFIVGAVGIFFTFFLTFMLSQLIFYLIPQHLRINTLLSFKHSKSKLVYCFWIQ